MALTSLFCETAGFELPITGEEICNSIRPVSQHVEAIMPKDGNMWEIVLTSENRLRGRLRGRRNKATGTQHWNFTPLPRRDLGTRTRPPTRDWWQEGEAHFWEFWLGGLRTPPRYMAGNKYQDRGPHLQIKTRAEHPPVFHDFRGEDADNH